MDVGVEGEVNLIFHMNLHHLCNRTVLIEHIVQIIVLTRLE